MKKQILALLLTLSVSFAFGQTEAENITAYIAHSLTVETGGYTSDPGATADGKTIHLIHLPDYYSFELLSVIMSNWIAGYSDINTAIAWRSTESSPGRIFKIITVGSVSVMVSYGIENNNIMIVHL